MHPDVTNVVYTPSERDILELRLLKTANLHLFTRSCPWFSPPVKERAWGTLRDVLICEWRKDFSFDRRGFGDLESGCRTTRRGVCGRFRNEGGESETQRRRRHGAEKRSAGAGLKPGPYKGGANGKTKKGTMNRAPTKMEPRKGRAEARPYKDVVR